MIKPVVGYEGLYDVADDGRVFRRDGVELLGNINSYGYHVVGLTKNGQRKTRKIHRLVAMALIPNPDNYGCVNHIDGNKQNNNVSNLEWYTKGYNTSHARATLNIDFSEKPVCQMDESGNVIAIWRNASAAATIAGYSDFQVRQCCKGLAQSANGFVWKYACDEFSDFAVRTKIQAIDSEARATPTFRNTPDFLSHSTFPTFNPDSNFRDFTKSRL